MAATVLDLQRLSSYGVSFHSFTEPHLSTDNEPVRDVLLALLASLAKVERMKISERTKAGLERARTLGMRIGRPSFSAPDRKKLIDALNTGKSWRAVSAATGIPFSTVQKRARLLGYSPPVRVRGTGHGG